MGIILIFYTYITHQSQNFWAHMWILSRALSAEPYQARPGLGQTFRALSQALHNYYLYLINISVSFAEQVYVVGKLLPLTDGTL